MALVNPGQGLVLLVKGHGADAPPRVYLFVDLLRGPDFTAGMRSLRVLMFLAVLTLLGCGHQRASQSRGTFAPMGGTGAAGTAGKRELIVTPDVRLAGKVARVNASGRFVVLNFPIGHLPALDQRLNVYHLGLKVGEVRVTGPQLDDNVVADLVAGNATAGDEVRE